MAVVLRNAGSLVAVARPPQPEIVRDFIAVPLK